MRNNDRMFEFYDHKKNIFLQWLYLKYNLHVLSSTEICSVIKCSVEGGVT